MQPSGPTVPGQSGDGSSPLVIDILSGRAGLRLTGDADLSTREQLRHALSALPADGTVHLELAGLRFIDVAGTRELITLVQCEPHPQVVLHDPPRALRRILELLWPDSDVEVHLSTAPDGRL